MRRFLYILGALTLVVIVAAAIGIGVLVYKGNALDADSKAFVDTAVPAIATSWSKEELLNRATPELRGSVKLDELRSLFTAVSQLGPFVEYEGATGQANMSYMTGSGSTVSASYIAKVKFKDGIATIRILLVKRDGQWMINGFHVDSSLSGGPSQAI